MIATDMRPLVLAKIMDGEALADIAVELGLPIAYIREVEGDMTQDQKNGKAIQLVAIRKATEILGNGTLTPELMKEGIMALSREILTKMEQELTNADTAQIMNIHAGTLSKINEIFFGKGSVLVNGDVNVGGKDSEAEDWVQRRLKP